MPLDGELRERLLRRARPQIRVNLDVAIKVVNPKGAPATDEEADTIADAAVDVLPEWLFNPWVTLIFGSVYIVAKRWIAAPAKPAGAVVDAKLEPAPQP